MYLFSDSILRIIYNFGNIKPMNFLKLTICAIFLIPSLCLGNNPIEDWGIQDIKEIWSKANTGTAINVIWQNQENNQYRVECRSSVIDIIASGPSPLERREQAYAAIFKLGFLFPHPRWQISPKKERLKSSCGASGSFRSRISKRGFHLHTMHPSEWVNGFLMDDLDIARDFIKWMVRNQQNILQVQTLRTSKEDHLKSALRLAKEAGLEVGFSAAFALRQQKSIYLVPLSATFALDFWKKPLEKNLTSLIKKFEFDYISAEMGTTEFTSTPAKKTLEWMEQTRKILSAHGKKLFIKIHTSTGQVDPAYGNYNFLAQYAHPEVGVLPHTVMFYGFGDTSTPVYGRENFKDIYDFMISQKGKRPTWYYPETSYYVGMDIDVPIFLTDYLSMRTNDLNHIISEGVQGHLNFTTGQELGYWLFDWNLAVQTWPEAEGNENLTIELLGEDTQVWKSIIDYQKKYFNQRQVIRYISSSNLLDELPGFHPIHDRTLIRKLHRDKKELSLELSNLEEAIKNLPPLNRIKNEELRSMLMVTWLRVKHAYAVRKIIEGKNKKQWLDKAIALRYEARDILLNLKKNYNRYPKSLAFNKAPNVTSYDEGYAETAVKLHFWEREEKMALSKARASNPFFMNMYNIMKLLF